MEHNKIISPYFENGVFAGVRVCVGDEDCYWTADLFSHIDDSIGRVCCSWYSWKQCIPYNDETKNLVGTTDDCPEYYKWWEE